MTSGDDFRPRELSPRAVQGTGLLLILVGTVYAVVTGNVLVPLFSTGGSLIGIGQYLAAVQDIRTLLRERNRKSPTQPGDTPP